MKYVFVVNSQPEKAKVFGILQKRLEPYKGLVEYELYRTKERRDATLFVQQYCDSCPDGQICFVACGGDGTINEVASALVGRSNKYLAVIPFGSGNDFIKYYPDKDFTDLKKLFEGSSKPIDIMKVNGFYSINICNFGFDAKVAAVANRISERGGKNSYRWGIVNALFTSRFNRIRVEVDGEQISREKMLLCTLSNNRYVGGEFCCAPKALNDDGLIDVCLCHCVSLWRFIRLVKEYRDGHHLDNPKFRKILVYRQSKHIRISSDRAIDLCLDGEIVSGTVFQVDIMERAVNLIIPS